MTAELHEVVLPGDAALVGEPVGRVERPVGDDGHQLRGGFGSNVDMRVKYNPEMDDKILSTDSVAAQGDGIVMAEKIGADTIDMEYIQTYPVCDPETGADVHLGAVAEIRILPVGAVLVPLLDGLLQLGGIDALGLRHGRPRVS